VLPKTAVVALNFEASRLLKSWVRLAFRSSKVYLSQKTHEQLLNLKYEFDFENFRNEGFSHESFIGLATYQGLIILVVFFIL